jgi:hypothetical protein
MARGQMEKRVMSPRFFISSIVWYVCFLHSTFLSTDIRIAQGMMNHWKIQLMDGIILDKETLGHMGHCVEFIRHVCFFLFYLSRGY